MHLLLSRLISACQLAVEEVGATSPIGSARMERVQLMLRLTPELHEKRQDQWPGITASFLRIVRDFDT